MSPFSLQKDALKDSVNSRKDEWHCLVKKRHRLFACIR